MQNIGLKFKTVGRGLAERFVFMPRPRNVFSLFAKIPSFSSPSPYFSSISSIYVYPRFLTSDSILGSALTQSFLVFYTRTRDRNFICRKRENSTNYSTVRSDSALSLLLSAGYKIFNPLVLVTTERGKKCKRSF